jgi:hypothetical protein
LIQKMQKSMLKWDHLELAARYKELKNTKSQLEDHVKAANVELDAVKGILLDQMEELGLSSMKLATGELLYESVEPHTVITDNEAFFAWIKAKRKRYLLSVHWQKANAEVKEILRTDGELPPGTSVYLRQKLNMRKG